MLINSLKLIYFSPTGTTKKILAGIASGINASKIQSVDLRNETSDVDLKNSQIDMAIIGMPTYISRIPPEAAELLKKIKGEGIPVVLVAVYGNNKFGDILLEMKNITTASGFVPIAAAAFIGEHSFSTEAQPIAAGRPDEQDMNDARKFGEVIRIKMLSYEANSANNDLPVPGNFPYRKWHKLPVKPPAIDNNSCVKCGQCESVCPMHAISINEEVIINPNLCIFCCACVKTCPNSAIKVTDPTLLNIRERLYKGCSERKIPEIFI